MEPLRHPGARPNVSNGSRLCKNVREPKSGRKEFSLARFWDRFRACRAHNFKNLRKAFYAFGRRTGFDTADLKDAKALPEEL